LTVDYTLQRLRRGAVAGTSAAAAAEPQVAILETAPPPATFVTPSHAWFDLLPSGSVRIGADALVATLVGIPDEVSCLPEGRSVAQGEPLVTIRRGQRELVLRAPLDGVVEKVQQPRDPHGLVQRPYGASWLCQVRPRELGPVLRAAKIGQEARRWLSGEIGRVRDFLCDVLTPQQSSVAVAADGGYPTPGIANQLDPASWNQLVELVLPAAASAEDTSAATAVENRDQLGDPCLDNATPADSERERTNDA
jgi:glycine cleavage system H lipoate-binding protein